MKNNTLENWYFTKHNYYCYFDYQTNIHEIALSFPPFYSGNAVLFLLLFACCVVCDNSCFVVVPN